MSNEELIAEAKALPRGAEWFVRDGKQFHVIQLVRELAAALESQPEPTANVDDQQLLYDTIEAVVVGRYKVTALGLSDEITDAILAAGFSRAQGDVTVEWGVIMPNGDEYDMADLGNARDYQSMWPQARIVSRTVTAWKETP